MSQPNPYAAIGAAVVTAAVAGARVSDRSNVGTLSERLRNYAYYMTEQQQTVADALLVTDLLDAATALRKVGK